MDNETNRLFQRGLEVAERAAVALERLAEEPVIQMETGPPICPHCEKMNPMVKVNEGTAVGRLGEFVILAECQNCNKRFFAVPVQWRTALETSEATEIVNEIGRLRGDNG